MLRLLPGLCLCIPVPAAMAQDSTHHVQTETYPSLQLLEFLADFGAIDGQTYELIEYHAIQDSAPPEQEIPDEK